MKVCYVEHVFKAETRNLLEFANRIISDYAAQGFDLTLRQLYYQMVARDIIPNSQNEYKRLGNIISDARRAGLVDWDAIVDRTRNLKGNSHWETPADILKSAEQSFQIDKWEGQRFRPEVWVEKDALIGVVERAARALDVDFFACRGYSSDSEMWRSARRCIMYANQGQCMYIIHLGDHDPSGIDMSRDIKDRFNLFEAYPIVKRIALNYDQIEQYSPPPNPAKETDSRWQSYVDTYGVTDSWELDALDPQTLVDLITHTILEVRDDNVWNERAHQEATYKTAIRDMRMNYISGEVA